MKSYILVVLVAMLGLAAATCPNLCNGHGTCGSNDRCTCFNNWQGADCSERVCAYGLAWVDAPSADDTAHWYAECSNKGICDRETGQCDCFAGYEGKGCRRSSCPNDCSGHGTCYYISQVKQDSNDPTSRKLVLDYGSGAGTDKTYYNLWDAEKIQACVCDPHYEGADCSLRQCPRGDNVLTTGSVNANGEVEQKDQANTVQELIIHQATRTNELAGTFTLTYTDLYGGVWETEAISVKDDNTHVTPAAIAQRVETALENLPNGVLEDVTVNAVMCGGNVGDSTVLTAGGYSDTACTDDADATTKVCSSSVEYFNGRTNGGWLGYFLSDVAWLTAANKGEDSGGSVAAATGDYALAGQCIDLKVEFSGDQNSGAQPLLQINIAGCTSEGCAPYYAGLTDADFAAGASATTDAINTAVVDVTTQVTSGNNVRMHKERSICSEHGVCDSSTGTCECFSGYYDEDCSKQTVLV